MDAVKQLKEFYSVIDQDARIGVTHISVYMALVRYCIHLGLNVPVPIDREQLMVYAKVSRKTYNRRMIELHLYGYITYEPSWDPAVGSRIYIKSLSPKTKEVYDVEVKRNGPDESSGPLH